jgi:hypothetical protein
MEEFVENWLNNNPEWFKSYVMDKLDKKTVERWLNLNGKRQLSEQSSGSLNLSNRRIQKEVKNRGSNSELKDNPKKANTGKASNKNANETETKSVNRGQLNHSMSFSPRSSHSSNSSSSKHTSKKANTSPPPSPSAQSTTSNSASLITKTPIVENNEKNKTKILNELYHSHMYTCVIHNSHKSNSASSKSNSLNQHLNDCAFVEELAADAECNNKLGKDGVFDSSPTLVNANGSMQNEIFVGAAANQASLAINSTSSSGSNGSVKHKANQGVAGDSSSTTGPGASNLSRSGSRKNSASSAFNNFISHGFLNSSIIKRTSSFLNRRNTAVNSNSNNISNNSGAAAPNETNNSLNILKYLIESKIKFPSTHINSASLAEKLKLRKEKKHDIEFLIELIRDISDEMCFNSLNEKIINNIKILLNAEKVSLFYICKKRKIIASLKSDSDVFFVNDSNKLNELAKPNTATGAKSHHMSCLSSSISSSSSAASSSSSACSSSTTSSSYSFKCSSNEFELETPYNGTLIGKVVETELPININNINNVTIKKYFHIISLSFTLTIYLIDYNLLLFFLFFLIHFI